MKLSIQLVIIFFILMVSPGCQTVKPSAKIQSDTGHEFPEILATNMSFDAATGEIKYTLPEAALVRIRIGIRDGGALLHNLVDWEARDKGEHVELWNKKDSSGGVDFGVRNDYMLVLNARKASLEAVRDNKIFRKAPRLTISFPESRETTKEGIAVISGNASVRVTIDPQDQKWLTETKYEVGFYIDAAFLKEDENGVNPYTYQLNTRGFNNGLHYITVDVVGYEGQIGTESVLVDVKNK